MPPRLPRRRRKEPRPHRDRGSEMGPQRHWFVENRLSDGGHALRCNTRSSECSCYVQIINDLRPPARNNQPTHRSFASSSQEFDWANAWVEQAVLSGRLPRGTSTDSRRFDLAFADLNNEAEGLGSLEFDELRDWLQLRIDTHSQGVAVLGISIPPNLVRLLGVILIVAVQSYAVVHLAEASTRMILSSRGDLGVFIPWVMLYSSTESRLESYGLLASVPISSVILVVRMAEYTPFSSPLVWTSFSGLLISVALFAYSVARVKKLRGRAIIHRGWRG